jgi:glutaredoxin
MIRTNNFRIFLLVFLFLVMPSRVFSSVALEESKWFHVDSQGEVIVDVYFFWSETCPHCIKAKPFIESLPSSFPWMDLHSKLITDNVENRDLFAEMIREAGEKAFAVPALFYCGKIHYGFGSREATGELLRKEILACRSSILSQQNIPEVGSIPQKEKPSISLPVFGEIDPAQFSLPVFTLILAGVDAFNPCAFFILLFLLSLLVHAQSRARMLLIGGLFLGVSGVVYFIFMAAWLNVFLMTGEMKAVTTIAGLFAVAISTINIKDFFYFKKGVSLSIPDSAKPRLYQRVVGLIKVNSLPSLIVGTILLALAANTYELLCTAGFPMVYTRILTLENLPSSTYYLYLVFYNVIYVIPLLIIVLAFTFTLGSRKLTEREGRILKLMSGLMMLSLGCLILFVPELLSNMLTALGLLGFAAGLTFLIVWCEGMMKSRKTG